MKNFRNSRRNIKKYEKSVRTEADGGRGSRQVFRARPHGRLLAAYPQRSLAARRRRQVAPRIVQLERPKLVKLQWLCCDVDHLSSWRTCWNSSSARSFTRLISVSGLNSSTI